MGRGQSGASVAHLVIPWTLWQLPRCQPAQHGGASSTGGSSARWQQDKQWQQQQQRQQQQCHAHLAQALHLLQHRLLHLLHSASPGGGVAQRK